MSEWQRRTLHVLVIIFIGFTTAIETAILAANGKKSNETIAVQVGNDGKAVPLFQQREQTCHDRSRYCPEWAELAECRKKNARVYMTDNCPLSCNLCNPLLEPWYPGESHGRGINRMTFESKVEKDFQIFTGVPQKGEFSRQSSPLRSEDNREYVKSRVHDVILSQSNYLDDYYRDIQYVKHRTLISASSIDVDDTDIPPGTKLPLAETCINRHSYCALWAIQGFCDMQPRRMKAVCAPMCHSCDTIELNGSKVSVLENNVKYHSSPFHRNDLFGIMDAIRENRVVIDWSTNLSRQVPTIEKTVDGAEVTLLDTSHIQKSVFTQKRSRETMEQLQSIMHRQYETGISRQQVIVMDNFTTPEICLAILDTIKFGVGFNLAHAETRNVGDDGFPESTRDYRTILNKDGTILEDNELVRNSSTILLYPTIKYDNTSQFAPSLERLVEKVALLVGIPVANVETPLLLEKFSVDGFRKESSHFQTSAIKERNVEKVEGLSHETFHQNRNFKQEKSTSVMKNARIFGFTLFLNDVPEGGSMHFPDSNLRVEPRMGKAVLFPTVVSLNGIWDSQAKPLDMDVKYKRPHDDSFLVEDQSTFAEHETVGQGTKYTITIYFTRFEDESHRR